MNKFQLEERLIDFSVSIINIADTIKQNYADIHLSNQMIRSGTSPSLNYGEAQSAEIPRNFVHKMGICLKELRETFICLKIIGRAKLSNNNLMIKEVKKEVNELISIFVSSIKTSKSNQQK